MALDRAGGHYCEICKSNHNVTLHHIIYGQGKRVQCEKLQTVIFLCYEHHQHSKTGVHFNRNLDLKLKRLASNRLKAIGYKGEVLKKALGGQFYE